MMSVIVLLLFVEIIPTSLTIVSDPVDVSTL